MGVVITEDMHRRTASAVRWVESNRRGAPSAPTPPRGSMAEAIWCRVTSATVDGNGRYPAVVTIYDAVADTWADYSAVKLEVPNGETLVDETRYLARPAGLDGSDEVYVAVATGTGAGYPVMVGCNVTGTSSNTGTGSAVQVTWSAPGSGYTFDVGGWYDAGDATVLTVPEDGYYVIQVASQTYSSNVNHFRIEFTVNGGGPANLTSAYSNTTGLYIGASTGACVPLQAGDAIKVYHWAYALTTNPTSITATISIHKVGNL